ncbi:Maf family protein [Beggiatoa leptomitoformis]|uniref:7-methyl-GTP pyrophosphatase n=1 Tax=Beggiatoa leptomitoformis TaxID=288004 RepID=A0A2N9YEF8_9GAMM|nr:nucleoside triphosphate pyrophosphatase [Beggiatoa leptomitoformis]ALG68767.1 septum formation inhibitor Maf [Beggiatoa leptomitoformis]AUI68873.1 septum formation inhibitor Maf [Beggiatoa leptomitoformis]
MTHSFSALQGYTLVLASTSPFRKNLLTRLGLPFETVAPNVDETPLVNETPEALVKRLSILKAQAVQALYANALIIGSDQVAILDGQIIGKPHTHDNAVQQLSKASGNTVSFLTGLCLLNTATTQYQVEIVPFTVVFRALTTAQIENYLQLEQPYHCAGSFRSESLGITLMEAMRGDDPNALVGLPLMRLIRLLENEGVRLI